MLHSAVAEPLPQKEVCLQADPTRFLSGSDDCTVRLWRLHDPAAAAVIDAKANVCSVQFSPSCSNLIAFGSANYRVYIYDLRTLKARATAGLCVREVTFASVDMVWCYHRLSRSATGRCADTAGDWAFAGAVGADLWPQSCGVLCALDELRPPSVSLHGQLLEAVGCGGRDAHRRCARATDHLHRRAPQASIVLQAMVVTGERSCVMWPVPTNTARDAVV